MLLPWKWNLRQDLIIVHISQHVGLMNDQSNEVSIGIMKKTTSMTELQPLYLASYYSNARKKYVRN